MFNALVHVYQDLEAQGITVFSCPLQGNKSIASMDGFIGIDPARFDTQAEEATALIHEEGHFTSGAFYTPYSPYQLRAQAEYRADRAASLKRVPLAELVEQLRAGGSVFEISEHFNVTPAFLLRAYMIYSEHLGVDFTALQRNDG